MESKCYNCPYAVWGSSQNVCTLNGCAFPYGRDGEGGWTNG